jgi:hypothetical protein
VSRWYFGAQDAREHVTNLTARWRAYTLMRGAQVWSPGRWAFLGFGGVQTYARMHGVRNATLFEAQITQSVKNESVERETLFASAPGWLPDESTLQIQAETERQPAAFANLEPALVAHGLAVYAQPPDLVAAFTTVEGERVLEELANLPSGTSLQASREDRYKKYSVAPTCASLRVPRWCVDHEELDACIDVMTRFCRLCRRD